MNDELEPFGGCDLFEPEPGDVKPPTIVQQTTINRSRQSPMRRTCLPSTSSSVVYTTAQMSRGTLVRQQQQYPSTQQMQLPSSSSSSFHPTSGRLVKNTRLYREPNGISKTVTYPIDDEMTYDRRRYGCSDESSQPSSSGQQWQGNEEPRGQGNRKLTRLTLRIGRKQLSFRVADIPPENQHIPEWEMPQQPELQPEPSLHQHDEQMVTVGNGGGGAGYTSKQCTQCNRVFATLEEIKRHIAETHSFRPFPCTFCSRSFPSKSDLTSHLKSHLADRPHACEFCSKRFRYASNLNQHQKLHATGRRHFCNMCAKCFKTNDDLVLHHTRCMAGAGIGEYISTERPMRYECVYCGKPFHHKRDKLIHERVHTGERPYECGYCGRGFTQSQALTSHIRLHTGERPYACTMCDKAFRDSSALRKHETNHIIEQQREQQQDVRDDRRMNQIPVYDGVKLHDDILELEEVEEEIVEEQDLDDQSLMQDYSPYAVLR